MVKLKRTARSLRVGEGEDRSGVATAIAWSVFLLLLVALALISWFGSFYIFGHPEEPFSYRVLKTLRKIEPTKQFELTAAPRGDFLGPQQLLDRYLELPARDLLEINRGLLRSFIRNYEQTKDPVPYVIGQFTVLDSYELGQDDFIAEGIVALARSKEDPRVLIEHVFPAPKQNIPQLHRMLLTGLDVNLQRRLDLSAVIHIDRLRDGRIKLTTMPILYGSYTSTTAPTTISLAPPAALNVAAGLPILRGPKIEAGEEKYASFLRRSGQDPEATAREQETTNLLVRVQRPQTVPGQEPAAAPAGPVDTPPEVLPEDDTGGMDGLPSGLRVLPALPVGDEPPPGDVAALPALPAQPVDPTPAPPPATPPAPTPTATPAPVVTGSAWELFPPGKMPRGRLVPVGEVHQLAPRVAAGERVYLEGSFVVTASGSERAVLRSRGGRGGNVRIIADFPAGTPPPIEGAVLSRDALRPFLITEVDRAADGIINVRVREITTP